MRAAPAARVMAAFRVAALMLAAVALEAFFDGEQSVMVMADDASVRRNRLNLLGVLRNQASVLARFDNIQA